MTRERRRDEPLSRDEERVVALLSSLRDDAPRRDPHLTRSVLRTARWQITARRLLLVVDAVIAGAATTVGTLVGSRSADRSGRG